MVSIRHITIAIQFVACLMMLLSVTCQEENDRAGPNGYYFQRDPKWTNLAPGGGSLVSGRGHFRPGFFDTAGDYKYYLTDPSFVSKRSRVEPPYLTKDY
uniref:Uncharacterized protein n=1 Tax=Rhabditophanes sp. KR3021 TaxID=114890 RepID=A0AC35U5V9_9BILA